MALLFASTLTLWVPGRWPLGAFQAGVYSLTIAVMLRSLWSRREVRVSPLLIPVCGVLVAGAVQIAARQTSSVAATREALLAWTADAALVFLGSGLFTDRAARRRFLRALFYFAFFVSVVAVAQTLTSRGSVFWLFPTGYSDYVMGPFVSRNLYAAFIELLLPIGLAEAIYGRRRWMHAAMCGAMAASVVAGASRAGVVLTAAEVAAALVLARVRGMVKTRELALALAGFAIPCVVCVAIFGGTAVWRRFEDRDPYAGRREMLRSSVDMIRERPWTGFGLGTWSMHYPRFAYYDDGTVTSHAHNDWAEWTAEGGLPLLALMLAVAALTIRPAARSLWGIGIVAVLAHCLVDSPLQNPVVAGWLFLLAGALSAEKNRN